MEQAVEEEGRKMKYDEPKRFYVIQQRASARKNDWLKLPGRFDTEEEAVAEFRRRYGGKDYEEANHRIMEGYYVARYRKVNYEK